MKNIKNLRLIEIELFSFCNRKCKWCPNFYIDRNSNIFYLNKQIFINLVKELKEINYSNYITFSRYNEPLSNIKILNQACCYLRQELPNCTLVTNTNGDYLTSETIDQLLIDELSIMDYDGKGIDNCLNKLKNLNCIIDKIDKNFIYAHYKQMKILYYTDWQNNYIPSNRGGYLPILSSIRDYPCLEPLYFIGINYDGSVSPCCNIRNDIDAHKPYIIGDLNTQTLQEVLNSNKRKDIIKNCGAAIFGINSPCYKCSNKGGRYTKNNGGIKYE